ncbi:hypothetical protein AB0D30_15740 [Streptomyces sp. NPDC048409]|uniref:hypothetical protein n=1 Tax=Streptomyces TaxID=1883 RepID=UPI0033317383
MRIRRILGLALAALTLVGASAAGAASAPNISRDDCAAAGGHVVSRAYAGEACALPDGTTPAIT